MAERTHMHFEEELSIRELMHLFHRIEEQLKYANNLDQFPDSPLEQRSGKDDFEEFLVHKYNIVADVLQLKFRQRGTQPTFEEILCGFKAYPSETDDEIRAGIEKRRSEIETEKRLYEEVARAFKIGPDDRLWPSYQLPLVTRKTGASSEGHGGRPKDPATKRFDELPPKDRNLSPLSICDKFEKEHVPLPDMLTATGRSVDGWLEAYAKNRQKVGNWLRERKRKPRDRGKL